MNIFLQKQTRLLRLGTYPQSVEEYNNEIAEAEAEYERGDSISGEELKKIMQTW